MPFLLSTSYFAPIQYFAKLATADVVILEAYEHYPKQTYRNRCVIYGANGAQTLTVPVVRGDTLKIYTKDVRVDYSMNWQNNHLRAIESAYRCSPFYEYYIDDIEPLLKKKHTFLIDLNSEITSTFVQLIGVTINLQITNEYIKQISPDIIDLRNAIHPKPQTAAPDKMFVAPTYRQVFQPKLGFIKNLSIIDLLFNEGPETFKYLHDQ